MDHPARAVGESLPKLLRDVIKSTVNASVQKQYVIESFIIIITRVVARRFVNTTIRTC